MMYLNTFGLSTKRIQTKQVPEWKKEDRPETNLKKFNRRKLAENLNKQVQLMYSEAC